MIKLAKKLFPFGVILILSFFAIKPLLSAGFFSMHDDQQVARLFEMDKSLTAGQFPVRWVEGLGFGYGYPLFNFYPPLTYYLGEIYHVVLRTGFIDSTKLIWLTALVGSALAMYLLSRKFFGRIGGVVSASFYLYAPYHAVDAYVRGAQAELFSFIWLPLILLFSYKTIIGKSFRWSMVTGVLLGLLMLTHNLIFLPFIGLFTLWYLAITLIYSRGQFTKACLLYLVSCILAFGLTAFFWLPALAEKKYTLVDQLLIKNLASYRIHFVCLQQLWDSPWGFGGSMPGCVDGISFKIGKLHIILSALSILLAIRLWKGEKKLSLFTLSAAFLALVSAFMTTDYSSLIWNQISQLWYLQFPWRFLEFTVLFSSLCVGAIVFLTKNFKIKLLTGTVVVVLVVYANGKYFTPQTYYHDATDSKLTSNQEIKWRVSSTSFEFMSGDVATKLNEKGAVWIDIDQTQVQSSKFKVQSGNFSSSKENFSPDRFTLVGNSATGATLQFQISNFPGWQIWLDSKPSAIDDNNKYRLLSLTIPGGQHSIVGQFTNTPVRVAGNGISILFVLLLGGFIFRYGTNRSRP